MQTNDHRDEKDTIKNTLEVSNITSFIASISFFYLISASLISYGYYETIAPDLFSNLSISKILLTPIPEALTYTAMLFSFFQVYEEFYRNVKAAKNPRLLSIQYYLGFVFISSIPIVIYTRPDITGMYGILIASVLLVSIFLLILHKIVFNRDYIGIILAVILLGFLLVLVGFAKGESRIRGANKVIITSGNTTCFQCRVLHIDNNFVVYQRGLENTVILRSADLKIVKRD